MFCFFCTKIYVVFKYSNILQQLIEQLLEIISFLYEVLYHTVLGFVKDVSDLAS